MANKLTEVKSQFGVFVASKAGLVSFFDFIVGANGKMLLGSGDGLEEGDVYDDVDFPRLLKDSVNEKVHLLVWNIKAQEKRVVELVPRKDWGGAGLLGVTIRLDDYGGADERLVRVLEIDDDSPAKRKFACESACACDSLYCLQKFSRRLFVAFAIFHIFRSMHTGISLISYIFRSCIPVFSAAELFVFLLWLFAWHKNPACECVCVCVCVCV